jgi:hypothetical protein
LERDLVDGLTVATLRRCLSVLDGYLAVEARWHGADVEALADSRHAAIQDWTASRLRTTGWDPRAEVSFNHFGDRGRYDVLAFHAARRIVMVVEVKTILTDLQETLGRLDVKTRLAPSVAAELGWNPVAIVPCS